MRMKTSFLLSLLLLAAPAAAAVAVGERVPAFTARTADVSAAEPKTTELDSQKISKPTVLFVLGTTCGATNAYVDRVRELEEAYAGKGVDFVYVYPNRTDSSETKIKYHKEKGLKGPIIDAEGGAVAKALGAQRTTEAFVIGKDGTLLYHGAVDDNKDDPSAVKNRYVAAALDEHLAGKPVTTARSNVSA
ncbi:MAG TPA: redoxin family protein [Candidatus Limnocylindrales bacterium]|nr:redoxin family protein [Candidatus Limnocylindrales bacterium]